MNVKKGSEVTSVLNPEVIIQAVILFDAPLQRRVFRISPSVNNTNCIYIRDVNGNQIVTMIPFSNFHYLGDLCNI